ncbi:MAG: hypothetical protein E7231_13125 [Cellulosilyticum sp.]|nr:hypothetical protein [Cellulosilyticum sp.]
MEQLIQAKQGCKEVGLLVKSMIEHLENKNIDEMFQVLVLMTHKMEQLIEEISACQTLLTQEIEIKAINEVLGEIIESVQNKDYVLLADLLQYEILEKMEEWHAIIEESSMKN